MLEVKSSQLNEGTGNWRMTVYSTTTKCKISLIETEDGIITYKECPKKITDKQIISGLEDILQAHIDITGRTCDSWDAVRIRVEELVELIDDRPHHDTSKQIGFPVVPKLVDLDDSPSDR
ncbi:MAG TPA: hypothetical protein DSN98_09190 [Thermoplasmata archaeon]|jgi:hypothetical protein|nr:MAG TPA: hypothetical protein DSN98_09190 [Thermoplasmata archaeon]